MTKITQEILRELLHYDPETGRLQWKVRGEHWFTSERIQKGWNRKYAGKEALAHTKDRGNKRVTLLGQKRETHRLIWTWMTGETPVEVDHIDGNPGNNRWKNLRDVSHEINLKNQKLRSSNSTGIMGVHLVRSSGKYQAQIHFEGKNLYLGNYNTRDEAAAAYEAAKAKYGFHENHGRAAA